MCRLSFSGYRDPSAWASMLNCRTDPFRFQTLSAGSFSGWYSFSILPFSSSGISIIISVTSHVYGFACSPQSHPGNVKGSGISVMVARTVVKDFSGVGDFAWVAHATRMQKAAERIVLIWSNVERELRFTRRPRRVKRNVPRSC